MSVGNEVREHPVVMVDTGTIAEEPREGTQESLPLLLLQHLPNAISACNGSIVDADQTANKDQLRGTPHQLGPTGNEFPDPCSGHKVHLQLGGGAIHIAQDIHDTKTQRRVRESHERPAVTGTQVRIGLTRADKETHFAIRAPAARPDGIELPREAFNVMRGPAG